MRNHIALLVVTCLISSVFVGCDEGEMTSDKKVVSNSGPSAEQVKTENKEIDDPVLIADAFYQAQLHMDKEKALSYCSKALNSTVKEVNSQLTRSVKKTNDEILYGCVEATQEMFWEIADDYDDVIDASYLYEEKALKEAIQNLTNYLCSEIIVYDLPEQAEFLSKKQAKVSFDVYAKSELENNVNWTDVIGGYIEENLIDKFMDDAGFVKKAALKKYMTQSLVSKIEGTKKNIDKAEIVPVSTRTYYLKKKDNSWVVMGYKVLRVEDSTLDVYGDVPDKEKFLDDSFGESSDEESYVEDANEEASDDGYMLPKSSSEYIGDEDLSDFSAKELTYARNEIYARHGYIFKSEELNDYFSNKEWYEPDADFDGSLSGIERSNTEFIKNYQNDNDLMYVPK